MTAGFMALLLGACGGYSKETVSLYREHVGLRVPNQQRLLALAADEAVERLDFKPLVGKRVVVELSGVFPHSRADVLDYVQGQVEGKLARDGAIVVPGAQVVLTPAVPAAEGTAGAPAPASTGGGAIAFGSDAEYRAIIGVSWAGVDTHDRKSVNANLLLKQIGLGVASLLVGGVLTSSDDEAVAMTGSITGGAGTLGAVAWYIFQPPTMHTYRLLGRVRLSVQVVPLVAGGRGFATVGEGQTELLIDPTAEEGYLLQ